MGLVTIDEAMSAYERLEYHKANNFSQYFSEEYENNKSTNFDIFLSHSSIDEELVLGARKILMEKGLSVYVDWINDPELDRSEVNEETAEKIRYRMRQCHLLYYLHTRNAALSKWCPWELGFFDGDSKSVSKVFIFPLVTSRLENFSGQEYLNLYPFIDIDGIGEPSGEHAYVWAKYNNTRKYKRMSRILAEIRDR